MARDGGDRVAGCGTAAPGETPPYGTNGILDSMLDARELADQSQRFGKRVVIPEQVPPEYTKAEYLRHRDGVDRQLPMERIEQGTHTTRYHRGFTRRHKRNMEVDPAESMYLSRREVKSATHATARAVRLGDMGTTNQPFDVITGRPKRTWGADATQHVARVASASAAPPQPRGEFALSDELKHSSRIILRDSHYRFFGPTTTGKRLDQRQEVQVMQGLKRPAHSSVLGFGRCDLPSDGVHDNFAGANYGDRNYQATAGAHARLTRTLQSKARQAEIDMVRALG